MSRKIRMFGAVEGSTTARGPESEPTLSADTPEYVSSRRVKLPSAESCASGVASEACTPAAVNDHFFNRQRPAHRANICLRVDMGPNVRMIASKATLRRLVPSRVLTDILPVVTRGDSGSGLALAIRSMSRGVSLTSSRSRSRKEGT